MKKIKEVLANTQVFQSIYINPIAEKWQNRIVFHDPIFPDEIPCVVALKSYRLENCIGLVVSAPLSRIRYFRKAVEENDNEEKWGKLDPQDILEKLKLVIEKIDGKIVYTQNEKKKTKAVPKEKMERIDKNNPHTKKLKPEKPKKQGKSSSEFFNPRTPCVPSVGIYPENINAHAKDTWDMVIKDISEKIYATPCNKKRWSLSCYWFEKFCQEKNITPYVKINILNYVIQAKKVLNDLFLDLDAAKKVVRKSKTKFLDVYRSYESANIAEAIFSRKYKVKNLDDCLLTFFKHKYGGISIRYEKENNQIIGQYTCPIPFVPKTKNDICLLINKLNDALDGVY